MTISSYELTCRAFATRDNIARETGHCELGEKVQLTLERLGLISRGKNSSGCTRLGYSQLAASTLTVTDLG